MRVRGKSYGLFDHGQNLKRAGRKAAGGALLSVLAFPLLVHAQGGAGQESTDSKAMDDLLNQVTAPASAQSPSTATGTQSAAPTTTSDTSPAAPPSTAEAPSQSLAVKPPAAESARPSATSNNPPAVLEEIVVTATKRQESQRKLAETVDVLKGKDLEDIGARDLKDILSYVPGVALQDSTGNFQQLSIRGVGPQTSGLATNTTVGVLINDVPMSDPVGINVPVDLDPYDLRDFEVLKGPQGTLFGASAEGGAIRYVLQKPLLGDWEAKGFTDWLHIQGEGSGMTYGGVVNIPVGEHAALRAVDIVQEVPGLYNDVNANGKDIPHADSGYKRSYRLLGTWQPTDRFTVDAVYLKQRTHTNDGAGANNNTGSFTRTDTPGPSTFMTDIEMGNLEARYNFDWASLVSSSAYQRKLNDIDLDFSSTAEQAAIAGVPSVRNAILVDSHSMIQELRLMSPDQSDSPWRWIGGVYYNRYVGSSIDNLYVANTALPASTIFNLGLTGIVLPLPITVGNVVPSPLGLSAIYFEGSPTVGVEESFFGELTRKLFSDRVSLTLGGRLYRETLNETIQFGGALAAEELISGLTSPGTSPNVAMKANGFNPKASASWQISDNVLWYATASHGFQFGGVNNPPLLPTDMPPHAYKPSSLWSVETGLRTDWFDKTVQLDLTPYLIFWKNLQIQQNTSSNPGASTFTANIGAARVKGIEGSIRWLLPIHGFVLSTSGSYGHPKVAEAYTTSAGQNIPTGTDLPQSPRLQTTSTLSYNVKLGDVRTGAGLTWAHQGHAYSDITHDISIYRYNTLAVNYDLALPHVFLAPEFTLNLTNALNAHAITGGSSSTVEGVALTQQNYSTFLRPRSINLRVSGHF